MRNKVLFGIVIYIILFSALAEGYSMKNILPKKRIRIIDFDIPEMFEPLSTTITSILYFVFCLKSDSRHSFNNKGRQ